MRITILLMNQPSQRSRIVFLTSWKCAMIFRIQWQSGWIPCLHRSQLLQLWVYLLLAAVSVSFSWSFWWKHSILFAFSTTTTVMFD
jgi:hypothetical protein